MLFAKCVFVVAGVYGLAVLLPQYFLEARTGRDCPPAITHPEYYRLNVQMLAAGVLDLLLGVLFLLAYLRPAR